MRLSNLFNCYRTLSIVLTVVIAILTAPVIAQTPAPFPRTYQVSGGGTITLYQPQIESWNNQTNIVAWFALSYEASAGAKPAVGTVKIEAVTDVSVDLRLVKFGKFTIDEINVPSLSKEDTSRIVNSLQTELPDDSKVLELDRVLAAVERSNLGSGTRDNKDVKADPPAIIYSSTPAILVGFDSEPIWSQMMGTDLKYSVNTNWDVFHHAATNSYYLRSDAHWFRSSDVKTGWGPAGVLPDSFSRLPADDNWKTTKANIPGQKLLARKMPKVHVVTTPTELIVVDGQPKYSPVTGTSLLWVSNTESDVFRNGKNGNFFYLVAGRWFSAPSLNGPWTFATPTLPADFRNIPVEHPRSRVLASVPGTKQATEAIVQASTPRTARVSLSQLQAPKFAFQGDPIFEDIPGTPLSRAKNTDKQIIKFGNTYYLCYQGVWFTSQDARGPWAVATAIPQEIYTIPASSPAYNVTYVTVKDDDPSDDWVTYSYLPAYTGMMVAYGSVVWGTGWYYPPYVDEDDIYPIYYPYYGTYGYSAYYNPFTGTFGRGGAFYGPYGGVCYGAVYNPNSGTYARGSTVYGAYSTQSFAQAYNPRTGTYAQTRQGSNVYGSWGSSYVQRGDDWAVSGRVSNNFTGNTTGGIRTSDGGGLVTRQGNNGRTTIGRTEGGNVYAGHDGGIYMNAGDGWQKYENGAWDYVDGRNARAKAAANRPGMSGGIDGSTINQLNRDAAIRRDGAARTRDLSNYQPTMGGRGAAGSFRGGGGRRR